MRRYAFSIALAAGLMFAAAPAWAHQHRMVGGIETTVGWGNEPAYAGFQNSVTFRAERPAAGADHDAEGTPVSGAALKVELTFGGPNGMEKVGPLDLEPAFGEPGLYETALIPTRPGTYTWHITGKLAGRDFDQTYTSGDAGKNAQSEGTYNDIQEPADIQFPAKDPNNADLAGRITRESTRLAARADAAKDDASTATTLGYVGIGLGALALIVAVVRKRTPKTAA